nr:sucrase ferredoxin [Kribbella jejuensis]
MRGGSAVETPPASAGELADRPAGAGEAADPRGERVLAAEPRVGAGSAATTAAASAGAEADRPSAAGEVVGPPAGAGEGVGERVAAGEAAGLAAGARADAGQAGAGVGAWSGEPVYLVCRHGRHDACCAVWGRPVAGALASVYPERTWECSHIGGDRFAANVVVLPHSLFYGHVSPARALEVARRYDEREVVPELLRGSGAFVPPVQAAQDFARAAGHSLAVGNLRPRSVEALSDNRWRILLASTNGPLTVEVSAHLDTVDARLTCAGSSPAQIRRFELHHLSLDPPPDP